MELKKKKTVTVSMGQFGSSLKSCQKSLYNPTSVCVCIYVFIYICQKLKTVYTVMFITALFIIRLKVKASYMSNNGQKNIPNPQGII